LLKTINPNHLVPDQLNFAMSINESPSDDIRITEKDSPHRHLEKKTVEELLFLINEEDQKVALQVKAEIPSIQRLVDQAVRTLEAGGKVFYIGAGTSGRLGILDASECPPTFGVDDDWFIGIIAGGDVAIRRAVEHAEDDMAGAWRDLAAKAAAPGDLVIGIAASGTTPYVLGGVADSKKNGLFTGCVTCNPASPLPGMVDYPVCVPTGPEFITGSTRMKAGTAQKMVLNMISTATMIRMGRIMDNRMVDMKLSNDKLLDRGVRMIMKSSSMSYEEARSRLVHHGSVRKVLQALGIT
jgi:N-acetylmuramic acid 6-phosphate etherase